MLNSISDPVMIDKPSLRYGDDADPSLPVGAVQKSASLNARQQLMNVPSPRPPRCSTPTGERFVFCSDILSGTLDIKDTNSGTDIFRANFDPDNGGVIKESQSGAQLFGNLVIDGNLGDGECLADLQGCITGETTIGGNVTLNANKGANSTMFFQNPFIAGDAGAMNIDTVPVSTPEPGSLILLGIGMMGLAVTARRKLRI